MSINADPNNANMFVTAQGSALTRYQRALERRHVFGAEIAAKEMTFLSLRDALGLLALYAVEQSPTYDRAAARWLGRLGLEKDDLAVSDYSSPPPQSNHCTVAPTRQCAC